MPVNLLILIPCHSLDDFPIELGEADAGGLLNAFAVAFHPRALAAAKALPTWEPADSPPEPESWHANGSIVIVPDYCESWLPHGWAESLAEAGGRMIVVSEDRPEAVRRLLVTLETSNLNNEIAPEHSSLPEPPTVDADAELIADFLAFGSAFLQVELLTRRMHFYSNLETGSLPTEIIAAAVAGDAVEARRRLSRAFELLLEARERFFPVETFLVDVCLLIPRLAQSCQERMDSTLSSQSATTFLATAADWEEIGRTHPDLLARVRQDWEAGRVGLIGGEQHQQPIALMPVEGVLREFEQGAATFRRLFGRTPRVWARRRFGLTGLLPQILSRAELPFALHVALDDGIYPDDEASKLRWEGADGVAVDAFSRIPLAAQSATSFLRFSQRMAESMEEDIAAAAMFVHWPEVTTPWFDDFLRISRYAPVLGRLVTLESFFEDTEPPGRVFKHDSTGYFAPYLSQEVARGNRDPISRFASAIAGRGVIDQARWLATMAHLLGAPPEILTEITHDLSGIETVLTDPDLPEESEETRHGLRRNKSDEAASQLNAITKRVSATLAKQLLQEAANQPGLLVINPLSFPRRATIKWPNTWKLPAITGPIHGAQLNQQHHGITLDLPAAGFQWLPQPADSAPPVHEPPTVADGVLRNEFFEVHLSPATGGIAYIKGYGRSPKRISQQLAFRFPRKRKVEEHSWGSDQTYYSEMRCQSQKITCDGPSLGEVVTQGEIVDQTDEQPLARFTQTTRLWRGRPIVEVDVTIEPSRQPEGDPWTNYFACRFAWNDEGAVLTRDLHGIAQPAPEGRFDAPHYVEIAEGDLRTTIIPLDTPFHRRTGHRMLDSLLIVGEESARTFRFVIACDQPYPLRAALEARQPPICVPTETGPPPGGNAGWLLRVDSKNVQITSVETIADPNANLKLAVRLLETEGRGRVTRLTCCRAPTAARIVNLLGDTMADLTVDNGAIFVDLNPYEIATIWLTF